MNGSEAAGDLVLIQTSAFLMQTQASWLASQQQDLHDKNSEVTGSLAAIHGWATE